MKSNTLTKSLRLIAFVLIVCAAAEKSFAQGKVEDEVRRNEEAKKDVARHEEAARGRTESMKEDRLNKTKSLNGAEVSNKETARNKPDIKAKDEVKLREASDVLKRSGSKEAADGSKKPSELTGSTSGDATQSRGRKPGKTK